MKEDYRNNECCGMPEKLLPHNGYDPLMAFRRWRSQFVPYAEVDAGGPICQSLFKEMVIGGHTGGNGSGIVLQAQMGSQVQQTLEGPDAVAANLCGLFSTVTHPERVLGIDAVRHVEECNGVWRGDFAGFVNASNNGDGFPPEIYEADRHFVIVGYVDDRGFFHETYETNCFAGPCGSDNEYYTWDCD
jgi:hypothetical protein